MATERLNILLIANNPASIELIRDALESSNTRCRLLKVGAGPMTTTYLRREGPYAEVPKPDLILFDIVSADSESLSVLKRIKENALFRSMPIVLLTNEDGDAGLDDIHLGRRRYSTFSPVDLDSFLTALNAIQPTRFMEAISLLENFGFVLVRMPESGSAVCGKTENFPPLACA